MRSVIFGLIVGALALGLIALGVYWTLDYGHEHEEQPAYQPGIELDIDRSKPRPTLKTVPPKQAAPKPTGKK